MQDCTDSEATITNNHEQESQERCVTTIYCICIYVCCDAIKIGGRKKKKLRSLIKEDSIYRDEPLDLIHYLHQNNTTPSDL